MTTPVYSTSTQTMDLLISVALKPWSPGPAAWAGAHRPAATRSDAVASFPTGRDLEEREDAPAAQRGLRAMMDLLP